MAENLLKYRKLKLTNLPAEGIIAISGCNESGKSSIGEAICFALFGRTFAVPAEETQKLIRWGESYCSVAVKLNLKSGKYVLTRSLDRDHNHTAKLAKTDSPNDPIARGNTAVATAMHDLTGYNFESFVESFYLAQREITTPNPHSQAIYTMAGIEPLAICLREFQQDQDREQVTTKNLEQRKAELEKQIDDLGFDSRQIYILETDQADLVSREQDIKNLQRKLSEVATDYQQQKTAQKHNLTIKKLLSRIRTLAFLVATISVGSWGLLNIEPQNSTLLTFISTLLSNLLPTSWLIYGILASICIFFITWLGIAILNRRELILFDLGQNLADIITNLDSLEFSLPKNLRVTLNSETAPKRSNKNNSERNQLHQQLPEGQLGVDEIKHITDKYHTWLEQILARLRKYHDDLRRQTVSEQERHQVYNRLTSMVANLTSEKAAANHREQLRQEASKLLQGATRHVLHQFNRHLRGLASRTLPLFTENRYQHIQIDNDLAVRVFSNEKRDFMDLGEVSSGTQRQMMLALRLSLSQQLVDRVVRGKQFIFLDEPFAFFDEIRTRNTIIALPKLSGEISQIWIVAQKFPEDIEFVRKIECRREIDEHLNDNALQIE
ncbi:hypothetical protein TI04_03655 [Achromatium sp. WMS2]|nr:hypothetical protein TI04_03655 [Achromatium sp. WMS2]